MKSYTDIEQSKKLAEILPLESADMWYGNEDTYKIAVGQWNDNEHDKDDIPCWSLSALLSFLPNNKQVTTTVTRGGWKMDTFEYVPNTWWCEYEDTENQTEFNISADNPVDACVKMIIKLKDLNLL